ncbi:MAG: hypothetical protein CMJ64_04575 [Planctomycetaceae bacterium]|nr:hypothetical protein [Planctomycetaceae bacterium]
MPDYPTTQESIRPDQIGINPLTAYRVLAGTILIVTGVVLGLYVAMTVFGLIKGDEPPGIVRQFADSLDEKVAEEVAANGVQPLDLSSDVKRLVLYVVAFLLLVLPFGIAKTLITSGTSLMSGEAAAVLKQIAEQLKKNGTRGAGWEWSG